MRLLSEWESISLAVRTAFATGNYSWTFNFKRAYSIITGELLSRSSLKHGLIAVEPRNNPVGTISMLLFFANGNCYEGELIDDSGHVRLNWLHLKNSSERPLLLLERAEIYKNRKPQTKEEKLPQSHARKEETRGSSELQEETYETIFKDNNS